MAYATENDIGVMQRELEVAKRVYVHYIYNLYCRSYMHNTHIPWWHYLHYGNLCLCPQQICIAQFTPDSDLLLLLGIFIASFFLIHQATRNSGKSTTFKRVTSFKDSKSASTR